MPLDLVDTCQMASMSVKSSNLAFYHIFGEVGGGGECFVAFCAVFSFPPGVDVGTLILIASIPGTSIRSFRVLCVSMSYSKVRVYPRDISILLNRLVLG